MSTTLETEIDQTFRLETIFHNCHQNHIDCLQSIRGILNPSVLPALNGAMEQCLKTFLKTTLSDGERLSLMGTLEEEIARCQKEPSLPNLHDWVELHLIDKEFHDPRQ